MGKAKGMGKEHCGKPMMGQEYSYDHPARYDGISEWRCIVCGYREGRWSGKELKNEEFEKPFGYDTT